MRLPSPQQASPSPTATSPEPPMTVRRAPHGYDVADPLLAALVGLPDGHGLPLPFTPEAHPEEVVAHLQRLNPSREVVFQDETAPPTAAPARS